MPPTTVTTYSHATKLRMAHRVPRRTVCLGVPHMAMFLPDYIEQLSSR